MVGNCLSKKLRILAATLSGVAFVNALLPGACAQNTLPRLDRPSPAAVAIRSAEARLRARHRSPETVTFEPGPEGDGFSYFVTGDSSRTQGFSSGVTKQKAALQAVERAAVSYLRDEADLLGLTEPYDELRCRAVMPEENGRTHIFFDRYVSGLRLHRMDVRVHLDEAGSVFAFNGYAVVLSPDTKAAIVAAAGMEHVSQDFVNDAIMQDLGDGITFHSRTEKLATSAEPHVVWQADVSLETGVGRWLYRFDARTGKLISKEDRLQTLHRGQARR